jgi:phosphatidylserine decarboxylase
MIIHKEGYTPIALCILFIFVLNAGIQFYSPHAYAFKWVIYILSFLLFVAIVLYFRGPSFPVINQKLVYSPVYGEVEAIAEVEKSEVLKEKSVSISIAVLPLSERAIDDRVTTPYKVFKYRPAQYYIKDAKVTEQGNEFGFIKSGSHINIFLPVGTTIKVKPGQVVDVGYTVLAELSA